ncbi:hypothetical protein C1T17_03270 [Sphingobium sp. SCG-1]|uniref:hypothetical protein n=1 Tax=Sphingobium sp. SCG-1 TaxID=2072936 RepID=UPI000CD684EC|nr:hypothetical protein [Sphingobium sp. SCG-1]AUW57257.1 hypothetical protein C1T17_03270 [Sphingobium sp. SCG-1]
MGIVKFSLLTVAILAAPVVAVAQDDSAAPVLQDFRLDPSRDPNRPRAPERAGPEIRNVPDAVPLPSIDAPAVSAPPPVAAAPPPPVARTVAPARAGPVRPVVEEQARPAPAPSDRLAPVADGVPETASPIAVPTNEAAPAPTPPVAEAATSSANPLPWIMGAIAAVLVAAFLLFRRRNKTATVPEELVEEVPVAAPEPDPAMAGPLVPAPAPPPPAVVTRVRAETPVSNPLTLRFTPIQVRTTFTGVQLEYRLTLRNDTAVPADGIAVAAFMANAEAQQMQVLAAFFDDPFAPEQHRITHLEPGAEIVVNGALSLDQVVPIDVQGRALLIPLVAFKAISLDGDDLARATFIVGQESTPPRPKMGPFRLDQGPRQYRDVGSRVA